MLSDFAGRKHNGEEQRRKKKDVRITPRFPESMNKRSGALAKIRTEAKKPVWKIM